MLSKVYNSKLVVGLAEMGFLIPPSLNRTPFSSYMYWLIPFLRSMAVRCTPLTYTVLVDAVADWEICTMAVKVRDTIWTSGGRTILIHPPEGMGFPNFTKN
jgi:hypothetical protein